MKDKIAPLKTNDSTENHAIRDSAAAAYESNISSERPAPADTARSLPPATIDAQGITFGPNPSGAAADQPQFSPSMLQRQILDPAKTQGNPELNPYHLHDVSEWTGRQLNPGETRQVGYAACSPLKGVLTSLASYIPTVGERLVAASGACSELTQKSGPGTDGKPFVETTYGGSQMLDVKAADGESIKSVYNVRTEFDPKTGQLNRRYTFGDDDTPTLIQHIGPDGTISTDKETFDDPRMVSVPTAPTKIKADGAKSESAEMMEVTAAASTYKPDGTHFTDYDIANEGTIRVQYKSDQTVERSEAMVP